MREKDYQKAKVENNMMKGEYINLHEECRVAATKEQLMEEEMKGLAQEMKELKAAITYQMRNKSMAEIS